MIRILDHSKALNVLASDSTNGLGKIEVINATVTEELNGIYEAQFDASVNEDHFADLEVGGIVEIPTSEGDQMFRIYEITKPINYISTVKCEHISYDLTRIAVLPFSATGASAACQAIVSAIVGGSYPFTMTTDISNASSQITNTIPRTFRECLGGYSGSFLDVFRGEFKWDNLEVKMLARRGSDQGVRISYGKNLTDFRQEENIASVYTGVLGYAIVDEQTYYGNVYHKVSATYPRIKIVDFSDKYQSEQVPTTAELTAYATQYANNNDIEVPSVNMTVSFVPLSQTEEYKNIAPLEDVYLGDTVHIYFEKLGVEASARVIQTEWNINTQRYESITLGSYKSNMSSVIAGEIEQVSANQQEATSFVQSEMNAMASLIINGLGLHRTLVPKSNGGYTIYLHNKETLAASDTQYVFGTNGFMVSTDYGQTWNAGFDSNGNAVVNSLSTIVLRALEIYGSRITFGDENDKYITAGVYTQNGDAVGVSFDGSGYARFRPQEAFIVQNLLANGDVVNSLRMLKETDEGGDAAILINNYDTSGNTSNNILMYSNYQGNGMNRFWAQNYDTNGAVKNFISMYNEASENSAWYRNKAYDSGTLFANDLRLISDSNKNYALLLNYLKGASADTEANFLGLRSDGTTNYTSLVNNMYNSSTTAGQLYMESTASQNQIVLRNKKQASSSNANYISMTADSDYTSFKIQNLWRDNNLDASGLNMLTSSTTSSAKLEARQMTSSSSTANGAEVGVVAASSSNYIVINARAVGSSANVGAEFCAYAGTSNQYALMAARSMNSTTVASQIECMSDGSVVIDQTKMTVNGNVIKGTMNGSDANIRSTIPNNAWTCVGSFYMEKGAWLVEFVVRFASNATGIRQLCLSSTEDSSSGYAIKFNETKNAVDGTYTYLHITHTISISADTSLYLNAYQNSGSTLGVVTRYTVTPIPRYY